MKENNFVLNEEEREMVEKNHNLIYSFVRQNNLNLDEYYDIIAISLCKAVKTFDKEKGFSFSTYAYKVMKMAMLSNIRDLKNSKHNFGEDDLSLDNIMIEDLNFYDVTPDIKSCYEYSKKNILQDLKSMLDDDDFEIVNMLLDGYTQKEISDIYNCSRQNINKRLEKIKSILSNYKKEFLER